jgi:sugar phosphate permease
VPAAETAPSVPDARDDFLEATYSKVFLRIVPFLMVLWVIAWIDRVNVGFAKLQMLHDLNFSEAVYGLGAGIFFLGYFLFEVPSNLLMMRIGAKKTIARITLGWGLTSMAMVFVKTSLMFYLLRFLLGVFEAGFYPGIILYLTYWFPTSRRALAFGFFMSASAFAGVIGGPLAGTIMSTMNDVQGLRSWQWVFLIEGIPSVIAGIATLIYLTDEPSKAGWLSPEEIAALKADLERDTASLGSREQGVLSSLRSKTVWQFIAIFFFIILANSALTFWAPSVIAEAGFPDPIKIGWLMAAIYLVGAAGMILNGASSDRAGEARLHCGLAAATGGVAMIALGLFGGASALATILCLGIAVAGTMSAIPVFWQMPNAVFSGAAAAAAIAMINSFANLAGLGAPWFIGAVKDATGHTALGFMLIGAAEIVALALILLFVRQKHIVPAAVLAH